MSNLVYIGKQNKEENVLVNPTLDSVNKTEQKLMRQVGDMGEQTAYDDELVRRTLNKVKKIEQKLIGEYNNLNNFKTNNYEKFLPYINDELEKRKVFLLSKKTSLENQHTAISKLLEHLLTVELKNKEFDTKLILTKLNMIEAKLIPYNKIL
jgi:hypothetical protein